jgi:hypothetical protein
MSPPLSPIQLVIGEPLPLMPLMTGLTAYPPIRLSAFPRPPRFVLFQ